MDARDEVRTLPKPAETQSQINRTVWTLASPILLESLLVALTGIADMIQVGRLGSVAITSVGLTHSFLIIIMNATQYLMVGTTAMVARFYGMKREQDASEVLRQSFFTCVPVSILLSFLIAAFAGNILVFMRAEPEVLIAGTPYARAVGYGYAFNVIALLIAAALRGAGDTRTPTKVNIWANLLNVVLNALLIFGLFGFPRWEVFGAGVATTLSRLFAAAWFMAIAVRGRHKVRLDLATRFRPHWDILRRTYAIGLPAAMEQVLMRSGQVLYSRIVASLGTVQFAAHQVGTSILTLTYLPGQAFGTASTALVSRNLGARDPVRAERCAVAAWRMSVLFGVAMALVFGFFGKYIALLYTSEAEVILGTASVLWIYGFAQPLQSTQFVLSGALRGAGDSMAALVATVAGVWLGRGFLGWLFVAKLGWGLTGAWVVLTLDQSFRGIFMYLRYRTGKWKETGMARSAGRGRA